MATVPEVTVAGLRGGLWANDKAEQTDKELIRFPLRFSTIIL